MDSTTIAVTGMLLTFLAGVGGAVIAGRYALEAQSRQFGQENTTRFHARRLEVYADFIASANRVAPALGADVPYPASDVAAFMKVFETARLVASPAVLPRLFEVHRAVLALHMNPADYATAIGPINTAIANALPLMRADVGVETLH
jgi:hypothetical protein